MAISVYSINKGVGRSIQFKGVKGRYIWWMGGGLISVLLLFVIFYVAGISPYICIALALVLGGAVVIGVSRLSRRHGEHGLMKWVAGRKVPAALRVRSRTMFRMFGP